MAKKTVVHSSPTSQVSPSKFEKSTVLEWIRNGFKFVVQQSGKGSAR